MSGAVCSFIGRKSGLRVNISDRTISDFSTTTSAVATFSVNSDGTVRNQNGTFLETWLLQGTNNQLDILVTKASGTAPVSGSALNTWLNLGSSRSWSATASVGQILSATLNVSIRNASSLLVIETATIILNVESGSA